MADISEIAPDIYRISVFWPEIDLQFNHFVVRDDQPLLFHTGLRRMFTEVREAMTKLLDPAKLRWISWSHFESDECGALNDWLATAPHAQPACCMVGALVNVNDFAAREARILTPQDVLVTGKYRFRYYPTPQLPHGWDAGVLFEETRGTLFCSDLFHQNGNVEPLATSSVIDRCQHVLSAYQTGPLANYVPFTANTETILRGLASLNAKTLAVMHGSSFAGDCGAAFHELAWVMKKVLDRPSYEFPTLAGKLEESA
jgi:flavorubredoxin